jgi:hypothetical protein
VGNIVGEHDRQRPDAEGGTRLLRPGARILLASLKHSWALLPGNHKRERVRVIGLHRRNRNWLECWVPIRRITDWRVQLEGDPAALRKLREAEWPGFRLASGEFTWDGDRKSPEAVRALLDHLIAADRRKWEAAANHPTSHPPWWAFWRWFARPDPA